MRVQSSWLTRRATDAMAKTPKSDSPQTSFQDLILGSQRFWAEQGCVILQPYDMEMGAGTFHPATTLARARPQALERGLRAALAPAQGRPLRREPQPAAALLPVPGDHEAVAGRLPGPLSREPGAIGIDPKMHDIRFVEDDWESPTLGAWGLGWEVWCDGMEVTQFTYFQQVGGFDCDPVSGEITYGLERLAMYVQGVDRVYDLNFNGRDGHGQAHLRRCVPAGRAGILALQLRVCRHRALLEHFRDAETECKALLAKGEPGQAPSDGAARLRSVHQGLTTSSICSMRAA